jgi:hypothetical protein
MQKATAGMFDDSVMSTDPLKTPPPGLITTGAGADGWQFTVKVACPMLLAAEGDRNAAA